MYDPQLGWVPAIPEPFWYLGWRSWFTWKPQCIECSQRLDRTVLFKDRKAWDAHYVLNHIQPLEKI